ncbi:hypothetical protein [Glutamicibacter nicotianae]|uniref:hypothetical protein n=1 Tax=Glutamicibacter nicotianae TaxID=37929 RepID=UPI0013CE8723|nr:hypothetical protein [Glutamicibacter nicotianae]
MKHPTILTLALAAGLATGIAGCMPASNETEASSIPSVAPTMANPTTPAPSASHEHGDAVDDPAKIELAKQAATIMTTWNPNRDFNRTAAEMRARKLMTSERAKQVIAPERPATGVEWLTAAEKKATSKPTVKLMTEHHEKDTVAVTATWQWVTKDGESWAGEGKQTFFFTFTDTDTEQDP